MIEEENAKSAPKAKAKGFGKRKAKKKILVLSDIEGPLLQNLVGLNRMMMMMIKSLTSLTWMARNNLQILCLNLTYS